MDPTAAAAFTPNTRIIISVTRDTRCNLWSVSHDAHFPAFSELGQARKVLELPTLRYCFTTSHLRLLRPNRPWGHGLTVAEAPVPDDCSETNIP
jgi:hypothetical protein